MGWLVMEKGMMTMMMMTGKWRMGMRRGQRMGQSIRRERGMEVSIDKLAFMGD